MWHPTVRRGALASLLIVHGLLHASVGVWAVAGNSLAAVSALWGVAIVAYVSAGFALLRLPVVRRYWKPLLVAATIASVVFLVLYGDVIGVLGIPIDLVLAFIAFDVMQPRVDTDIDRAEQIKAGGLPHPRWRRLGWTLGALTIAYLAVVVAIRPMYLRWGTTPGERAAALPGDVKTIDARYRVDHAITIHAPADSVWPWLVQLGQDKGGFYSYSRLERAVGDRVRNADRVHPEWQSLTVGDTIRATQPGYLGGRFGTLGRKVTEIVPGRALVLENWGAFVVHPVDSATSRLIVRTRGEGKPTLAALLLGPLNVFVFEPAHFIMQRGMLRGIRDRAEGRIRGAT